MLKKITFLFTVFMATSFCLHSQSKRDILYKESMANEFFHKQEFKLALTKYLELDSINPGTENYSYHIALSYINLHNDEKALPYIEKCLKNADKYPSTLYYYAGKGYQFSHQFEKAIENYEVYLKYLEDKKGKKKTPNIESINTVKRDIEMCQNGIELLSQPLNIEIQNLGPVINSPYPDYAAVLSADESEIVFTSTRPGTTGGGIDPSDGLGLHFEDIYKSTKTESGWSQPVNIGMPVNSNGNDASIALSSDGQKLLIYRSIKENFLSTTSGDLYLSELKGRKWSDPQRLPDQINSKGWEPSASLSSDERVLFFTSDRPGGQGGTDLYMVRKLPHGEWAVPMNLGPRINTPYDEDSPFMHPDGKTLYFSSKGHKTMGGFDVFSSTYDADNNTWSDPVNVGYPISTAHDDIHFTWSADGKRVYFSSIRPEGYGDKDLYMGIIEKEEANLIVLKGIITDSSNYAPVEALIKVIDGDTKELIGVYNSNSETGKYLVVLQEGRNYSFSIAAEDFLECNENISVPLMGGFEVIEKNIRLCSKKQ